MIDIIFPNSTGSSVMKELLMPFGVVFFHTNLHCDASWSACWLENPLWGAVSPFFPTSFPLLHQGVFYVIPVGFRGVFYVIPVGFTFNLFPLLAL